MKNLLVGVVTDAQGKAVRVGPRTLKYLEARGGAATVLGTDARTGEPRRAQVVARVLTGGTSQAGAGTDSTKAVSLQ